MADVREYARERAELSSLRKVAPEIGLGHSTLHNFLKGANPHPRVWRALRTWYAEASTRDAGDGEPPKVDPLRGERERLRTLGPRALSSAELVALLLTGLPGPAPGVEASQDLLHEFSASDAQALRRILAAPLAIVAAARGLRTTNQAELLLAGLELGRRAAEEGGADADDIAAPAVGHRGPWSPQDVGG
jgi:hypothetical protein